MTDFSYQNLLKKDTFFLLAGPCVVEEESITMQIAETLSAICKKHNITYVFKASYRKANRTRIDSYTGMGDVPALEIIQKVGKRFSIPTITDIHTEQEAALAAQHVDVLQIPAFLCRQTDLLVAAGKTGKIVNVKKAQFSSAESMKHAVDKVASTGNTNILLTERGTMFGYQDLVVDYRNIPLMQKHGYPVVLDITHSLQQPNQTSGVTGGRPELIATIAKAGIAAGVDGIFLETHPNPAKAKSDGANMIALDKVEELLEGLMRIKKAL